MQNKLLFIQLFAIIFVVKAADDNENDDDYCHDFEKLLGPECKTNPAGPYCWGHGDHGHCQDFDCGDDAADSQACKDVGYTYRTQCKNKKCIFPSSFDCTNPSYTSPCNENQFATTCSTSTKKCVHPSNFVCEHGYYYSKCNDNEVKTHCLNGVCVDSDTYLADPNVCMPESYNSTLCIGTQETPQCDWKGKKCQAFTCWVKDNDDNRLCSEIYTTLKRCNSKADGCTFNENYECETENTKESQKCKEHATRTACLNKKCVTIAEFESSSQLLTFGTILLILILSILL